MVTSKLESLSKYCETTKENYSTRIGVLEAKVDSMDSSIKSLRELLDAFAQK